MASRTEELRAYRFAMRRLLGAVVSQRADAAVSHSRRATGALGAGVAIAVISLVIVAAIGLIAPGATDWRRIDAVIVEKETGARFVYLNGALHPVLNYTSARLIVGAADAPIVSATRADLAVAPRGNVLGIPGAPDSLPAVGDIHASTWSVCTDSAGATTSVIAAHELGGRGLGERAILGTTTDGTDYLIWHNRRFRIADPDVVLPVPLKAAEPQPVPVALVNALPPGSDLKAIPVDRGHASPVGGLTTGTIVYTGESNGSRVYGLVRADGVAILTPLEEAIVASEATGEPVKVGQQVFDGAATSIGVGTDWPREAPGFAAQETSVCVDLTPPTGGAGVTVGAQLADAAAPTASDTAPHGAVRLIMAPGDAALVRPVVAPGSLATAAAAPVYLLTDAGKRFPIADADTLASLGYASAAVVTLPSDVLDALPTGVVLSRTAARKAAST